MCLARKPFVRSTTLLAASVASFVLLSSSLAQERDSRLELAAAVGQPAAAAGSESAPSGNLRRAERRHALGHRLDVPARPVGLARDLADQSAGREPASDFPGRHSVARLSRRRPARRSARARATGSRAAAAASSAFRRASARSRSRKRSRRFLTKRSRRSCRARACSTRTRSTTCRTSSRIAKA